MNNLENVKCLICGYETDNHQSFNSHISHAHHIKSKEYYDTYLKKENEGICLTCGKPTKFKNMWNGYRDFCCNSCMSSNKIIQEKRKQTSLQHYGTEFPHQAQEVKDKMANTCLEKYGATNVYASDYGKQKIKETCQNKYNTNNPAQAQEVKEKMANTCLEKYGITCPISK